MNIIEIKEIKWKQKPRIRTKQSFDLGEREFDLIPVLYCNIPDYFNVFESHKNQPYMFISHNHCPIKLYVEGYDVSKNEFVLSTYQSFEKEFPIKAYVL